MTHTNRLAHEKSPYLLQHAHNPVDWYPWGEEAFEKARREDKPIFLSVGYSTCHWCHVMERESFEVEETAAVVNRHFVAVKVDREERPDVDRIYMAFVQATTQRGGWPMSVFLTPDLKPFYGGTYFPPQSRYGMPGFKALLEFLAVKWKEEREKLQEVGIDTLNQLESMLSMPASSDERFDRGALDKLFNYFRRTYDSKWGGFGGRPKFPRPVVHEFLLRYHHLTGAAEALDMVTHTLREMANGGMNDQLGGGFHRYSVDERWFVSHFEKMLYDQAQLANSYLDAYQLTGDEFHAGVARDIFDYVLRDMTHPEGGFFSAEDADSVIDPAQPQHKGEGAFYVWSYAELAGALTAEELDEVCRTYGVEKGGNVDEDPHQEFTGKNILYVARATKDPALLRSAKAKLLTARGTRVRPHLDDKVLTGWNGLMISAFAKGAAVLGEPRYAQAAERAAHFILKHLYKPENASLLRRYRDGDAAIAGFLDDYASLGNAFLDLYEAVFDPYYFELAVQLTARMIELFEDTEHGGFFSSREGDASLVMRLKEDYDGAEPSGNSMAVQLLVRLSHVTDRADIREASERALRHFSGKLASQGVTMPRMVAARMQAMTAPRQIVLVGDREHPAMAAMLRAVRSKFMPGTALFCVHDGESQATLSRYAPALASMKSLDGLPTAYVCENFACQLPVTDPARLAEMLTA